MTQITRTGQTLTRLFILLITTLMLLTPAYADERIAGHWEGKLEVPGKPLVVKVDFALDGTEWTGTIDIPAQGAAGLPLSDIQITEVSEDADTALQVRFAIEGIPGNPTFDGEWHVGEGASHKGVISGTFRQGAVTLIFRLSRDLLPALQRPQEPKPPFPYTSEEVQFENGPVTLAGTLTVPPGTAPFPAVLLISGSGPQDRDESMLGHKPFWVLADHLSRAGIAVLRVDDPGVGGSTPHPHPATTADFATDVEAGLSFLKSDERFRQVGLIGHSEGGLIATIVGSGRDDVDFVVLMAGPGVPGTEVLLKQNERIYEALGIPGEKRQQFLTILEEMFTLLTSEIAETEMREQLESLVRQQFELDGIPREQQDDVHIAQAMEQVSSPWMRYFLTYDPRPALESLQMPILVLNGKLDLQVDAEQNLTAIVAALEKGGNRNVTLHRLPKHNHLFQRAESGLMEEYGTIAETISPRVLDIMRDWIHSVTKAEDGTD